MVKRAEKTDQTDIPQNGKTTSSTPPGTGVEDIDLSKLTPRERHKLASELQARMPVMPSGEPMTRSTAKTPQQLINEVMKPSTAKDFLEAYVAAYEEGIVVVLSVTGLRVRMCTVDIAQMLVLGEIPDFLSPIAAKTLWIEQSEDVLGNDSELAKQVMKLIDYVVPLALIEPKVVVGRAPDREANEIALREIPFADRYTIFSLAIQPTEVLRQFRNKQAENLETLFVSAGWELPTEQDLVSGGNREVSSGVV